MEFIHTSLSEQMKRELNQPFLNMPLRNRRQRNHRHVLTKEERERIFRRSNWNSTLNRNQYRFKYSTIDLRERKDKNSAHSGRHKEQGI